MTNILLQQMEDRLVEAIAETKDDLAFFTEVATEARFFEGHDEPEKDVTVARLQRMRDNIERDDRLLEQVREALRSK